MSKHTAGPWEAAHDGMAVLSTTALKNGDVGLVASVYGNDPTCKADDVMRANARLIAASPELLDALREITADYADRFDLECPSTNPGIKSSIALARAAIAKAEGTAA